MEELEKIIQIDGDYALSNMGNIYKLDVDLGEHDWGKVPLPPFDKF
jgi:hypothetical protein